MTRMRKIPDENLQNGAKLQKIIDTKINDEKSGVIGDKEEEELFELLSYSPGFISDKEIEESVQEMSKYASKAAMLIYTEIAALLDSENTVLQFQMYGLGPIWPKGIRDYNSHGTFQLAVAFTIVSKLKEKFGNITMTSQEPCHLPAEIEYLQKMNVHVFDRWSFSPDHFVNAISASGARKPVMICYMIHLNVMVFESFLEAHWAPEILSKIIFVGNWFGGSYFLKYPQYLPYCNKTKRLFELMIRKTLFYEKLIFDDNHPVIHWGWPAFHGHPSDFLFGKSLNDTDIYRISYENAKELTHPKLLSSIVRFLQY